MQLGENVIASQAELIILAAPIVLILIFVPWHYNRSIRNSAQLQASERQFQAWKRKKQSLIPDGMARDYMFHQWRYWLAQVD